uniref:mitochondrial processing peptidase n=1 Tax=Cyanoptyche gloeocystis TaxID=77922 RepID=A0A7S2NQZ2_9EUKA
MAGASVALRSLPLSSCVKNVSYLRRHANLSFPGQRRYATALSSKYDPSSYIKKPILPSYTPAAELLVNVPETKVTVLSNGLRVATEKSAVNRDTATVGVFVDAGSRYETDETNGVAHFLEHMAFKGTKRRSQYELEVEIENIGGHLNAYTSREQTVYYAKVFKQDVPKAVDILSDILQNSKFEESSIERERDVIMREMEEVDAHVQEFIFDQLHSVAFQGSSLGRTILGAAENVAKISRKDCLDFIATHYTAPRIVIAAAGAVEHDDIVSLASKHLESIPNTSPLGKTPAIEPATFVGSEVRHRNDDIPTITFALAYPTCGWTDADAYPLMVLQAVFGAWEKNTWASKYSSPGLAQMLAKDNLANKYWAFNTSYADTGLFGIYCETVPDEEVVQDCMYSVTHELVRLCFRATEEEVQRAKNVVKTNLLIQLENGTSETCEDIGRQLLTYGRRIPLVESFARIDAVDVSTIQRVAEKYFYDTDHAMASYGSVNSQNLPDYNWIRRRSYWLRY